MTKEKWLDIYREECDRFVGNSSYPSGPESWESIKKGMKLMIENVDEATEVYQMENKE